MAIVLQAIAQIAGIRSYLCIPTILNLERVADKNSLLKASLLVELLSLDLLDDPQAEKYIRAENTAQRELELPWTQFHGAILLDFQSGDPAIFDPYATVTGAVPAEAGVRACINRIEQYRDLRPNHVESVSAGQSAEKILAEEMQASVQELGVALGSVIRMRDQLTALFRAGIDPLPGYASSELYLEFLGDLSTPESVPELSKDELIAAKVLYCSNALTANPWPNVTAEQFDYGLVLGLSYYLLGHSNRFSKRAETRLAEAHTVHPAFEICEPYSGIGMRVLNDLSHALKMRASFRRWLLSESDSQLGILEDLLSSPTPERIRQAISLPAMHLSIRRTLQEMGQLELDGEQAIIKEIERRQANDACRDGSACCGEGVTRSGASL